jgi:hypothetical protein
LPSPFLMERVVITVLRSCIHLYDLKAVRSQVCCISCNSHC